MPYTSKKQVYLDNATNSEKREAAAMARAEECLAKGNWTGAKKAEEEAIYHRKQAAKYQALADKEL